MSEIEKKKLNAELLRVQAAKAEIEYLIAQKMEEVERLQAAIVKQEETEGKILAKIKGENVNE